jgi:hypothetical protein
MISAIAICAAFVGVMYAVCVFVIGVAAWAVCVMIREG